MLFFALAGLAGLVWGVADFSGGKATQRADALSVVWLSKLVSLPVLVGWVVLTQTRYEPAGLGWGVLAGVSGTLGTTLFYRGLSSGAMTVVAPVTSVTSVAIPVVVGLGSGERPSVVALAGVSCALVAVALVSLAAPARKVSSEPLGRLVGLAAGAGLGFALFMICLARAARATDADEGLWAVLASHATGLLLGAALLLRRTRRRGGAGQGVGRPARPWPRGRAFGWSCGAGLLDTSGSAAFLLATRHGDLSLVAPLAALYPVSTVLLALVVDKERLRPPQAVGLVLAVAALQLVAQPDG